MHRRWSVYRSELYVDIHPTQFKGKLTNSHDNRNNLRKRKNDSNFEFKKLTTICIFRCNVIYNLKNILNIEYAVNIGLILQLSDILIHLSYSIISRCTLSDCNC